MNTQYLENDICFQVSCKEHVIISGLCRSHLVLYRALKLKREARYEAERFQRFVEYNAERRRIAGQVLIRLILSGKLRLAH